MALKKPTHMDRDAENTVAALDKIKRGHTDIEDAHGKLERAIDMLRDERDEARVERDSSLAAHKAEVLDLKERHKEAVRILEAKFNEVRVKLAKSFDILSGNTEVR